MLTSQKMTKSLRMRVLYLLHFVLMTAVMSTAWLTMYAPSLEAQYAQTVSTAVFLCYLILSIFFYRTYNAYKIGMYRAGETFYSQTLANLFSNALTYIFACLIRQRVLTYPCIFQYQGSYFMIPETSANKTIEMYHAEHFPDKWVLDTVLQKGEKWVDTTVRFQEGNPQLFTYRRASREWRLTQYNLDMDDETLDTIAKVYELVVEAGVHRASSIKVAEAAKVIENSQRDINIAFMNELSIIFNRMGIDTLEVLEAAGTKWNFLPFRPGLVGGHCIGVDPYYLTYKAETLGYHSQVILSGRRINDDMGKYVAEQTVKQLIKADKPIRTAKVGCLGITFKGDCPDARNSKVNDILKELREYGIQPLVCDPVADAPDAKRFYNVDLVPISELKELDCLIIAVAHREIKTLTNEEIAGMFKDEPNDKKVLIDVKGVRDRKEMQALGYRYWRL